MERVKATLVSQNRHKLRELERLLPGWELEPTEAAELPEETGETFYENALGKARFGRETAAPGRWAVGEDSGLEVDGLGGRPGIRSARYAGAGATDEGNVARLLAELTGVAGDGRRARYVCELVCLGPSGEEVRGRGTLEGRIAREPRGGAGFGYDPVFVPEGEERTVAELGDDWKRARSHRAAAAAALLEALGEKH
ncbi:MAG TPA: RdgB/HAM1 family non-canonical purine NTP pyrophosphatase [Gaiellaceae bacterium]|nr:RdgB/HAM1 family non-canonical purine NTP pyrophosphatase [Gaiellaceae bacterium]